MKTLTTRQEQVLSWIKESIDKTGQAPTVRELQAKIGCSAPMGVVSHLNALELKGYISRIDNKPRGIIITNDKINKSPDDLVQVPLVGNVACGMPIWAEELVEEIIPLPRAFVGYGQDVFMLRAQGDSMNQSGIDEGDYILFHKQDYADSGDKVVVLIGSEATVKQYIIKEDHEEFVPNSNNKIYRPLIPEMGTYMIQGKVIGVIKKYK
jgi:repressor LexA